VRRQQRNWSGWFTRGGLRRGRSIRRASARKWKARHLRGCPPLSYTPSRSAEDGLSNRISMTIGCRDEGSKRRPCGDERRKRRRASASLDVPVMAPSYVQTRFSRATGKRCAGCRIRPQDLSLEESNANDRHCGSAGILEKGRGGAGRIGVGPIPAGKKI